MRTSCCHTDLKNLDLLSAVFPEYSGKRRRAYVQSVQREDELTAGPDTTENGFFASDLDGNGVVMTDEDDIMVNQCKSAIMMECPENLSDDQVIEAEAYAALFAIGGYTYNNLVHETSNEVCNSVNNKEEDAD